MEDKVEKQDKKGADIEVDCTEKAKVTSTCKRAKMVSYTLSE